MSREWGQARQKNGGQARILNNPRWARFSEIKIGSKMKGFVSVTDNAWFSFLSQQPRIDEVNFWQPRELIRHAMMSVANMAIFPMEDILGLGEEARMNRPPQPSATGSGNFFRSSSHRLWHRNSLK